MKSTLRKILGQFSAGWVLLLENYDRTWSLIVRHPRKWSETIKEGDHFGGGDTYWNIYNGYNGYFTDQGELVEYKGNWSSVMSERGFGFCMSLERAEEIMASLMLQEAAL